MDSTAVEGQRSSGEDLPSSDSKWQSELYDRLLEEALGEDALGLNDVVVGGLTATELLRAYALGRVSRDIDVRERTLQAQGRAWFSIAGAGREVIGWAFARHLRPTDPKLPYYRDRTLLLAMGETPEQMFMETVGAATGPSSGGRQMPSHWGFRPGGVISQTSPTGTQALPAVGLAEGIVRAVDLGIDLRQPWKADSVVYVSIGEGTTAQGEVEEAIRQAVRIHAPVVFLLEDDKYAISIPVTWSIPGGDAARLYRHYEDLGMLVLKCDGTDPADADACAGRAVAYARERRGPVLLHAKVTRPMSHSSTDSQEQYRAPEDLADELARDPLARLAAVLRAAGYLSEEDQKKLDEASARFVRDAVDGALAAPRPDPSDISRQVTATDLSVHPKPQTPVQPTEPVELRYSIARALEAAMAADPRIVMFGEDVADAAFPDLPGKGGVFHVTRGLQFAYPKRVWNSALAEATIIGTATGQSLAGLLPVIEIQFRDYLHPGWQQLVDEAATLRWRSQGDWTCPMVIRMSYGGYLGGAGALWHSEANVGALSTIPGVRVLCPSNATDAAGLLRSAIESDDVVLFLEPKALYARKAPYPGDDYRVPIGTARSCRAGTDTTIVCWGNLVPRSLEAAEELSRQGIEAEVIDLRTVDAGWDVPAVLASVDTTGSLVVAEEDRFTGGFGATVASTVSENLAGVLIRRVAAKDVRVAYGPEGERAVLPQTSDIVAAARRLVEE